MGGRWVTFDCYGTLVDWNTGLSGGLAGLIPGADPAALLAEYHRREPAVQAEAPLPYRAVMTRIACEVAAAAGHALASEDAARLPAGLPAWPVFDEVPEALRGLREDGWRIGILSNTDPDLIDGSLATIGVPADLVVTVAEAGSYKPSPGHWERFRRTAEPDVHVHVAQSMFHDIEPCAALGLPAIWVNRLGEAPGAPCAAELPDLRSIRGAVQAVARAAG